MGLYSNYIFPRLLELSLGTEMIQRERQQALSPARGEVLEIGFGTGLNLPHFPPQVTKLVVLDPEKMLSAKVAERISAARMPVEQVQLDAGRRLPFADASYDTVVTTFTLCSIPDVAAALAEVRRVLKPEGRYIFLEHGRSDLPRVAKWQDRLNPIQRLIGCGCNMNRPIDRIIKEAGLKIITLDRYQMPHTPRLLGEMYRGTASSLS